MLRIGIKEERLLGLFDPRRKCGRIPQNRRQHRQHPRLPGSVHPRENMYLPSASAIYHLREMEVHDPEWFEVLTVQPSDAHNREITGTGGICNAALGASRQVAGGEGRNVLSFPFSI